MGVQGKEGCRGAKGVGPAPGDPLLSNMEILTPSPDTGEG